ncbi:DUF4350 domain-containing protein [Candidatus Villigracilis affinis]|uniref:DUF4350 domain-containing protein n=1 Tax=Candidatus Villigracilis affinis TaxID=3140682 RepID=UPI002A1F95E7|nr:hypothetical protein [Anaerolineales bacterium]
MKKNMLWIAIAALIFPLLARGLWFYRGIPNRPEIGTPDYQALTISQPPLETPSADEVIDQINGIVLLDFAHANQYQPPETKSLQEAIEKRGGKIETLIDSTLLEYKLKYASAYIVISPSYMFSADETRIVKAFVDRGGRLLAFTDATRGAMYYDINGNILNFPDTSLINPLLSAFGITLNNDYLYNVEEHEGNFRNVFFDDFGKNELTFGLKRVALYGTHSVKTSSGLILLRGAESTLSSIDDAHDPDEGGAALSADGNVLAFGDFTFLTSPYQNVADNATLIANIADFTLGGKQIITLANFPFTFTQPVLQVYRTSEVRMTAEMTAALSGLQESLRYVGISIEITDEQPDGDALILGLYTPSDELLDYVKPFDIELDDNEFINVPGFGEVGRYGNALLLFNANKKGNTITLLADTPEDLIVLLNTLASNSLSGCIQQGDIAVCSVGYGGSYSDGSETETEATTEPATEEVTPTPGG